MDEYDIILTVEQRLSAEPGQQLVPVGGIENLMNRVFFAGPRNTPGNGEQMKIMVAEDCDRRRSKTSDVAEHPERIWPSIDKVADEPKPIAQGIKANMMDELL